ncbi:MAG: formamidopyrimidine-DNA glycosylase [Candidatus Wallbacteria bacterium]|nr:formamidopyrimidine-DNA glycosylase [Candidatus Wallbacteria bacterium]
MPELPDILVYLDALEERVAGQALERIVVRSPSLLRTYEPHHSEARGRCVTGLRRIGKRLVLALEGDLYLVLHLMIAGRLHWKKPGQMPSGKYDHAAFGFEKGTLLLTESSTRKRAELHVVRGAEELTQFVRGGLDVLASGLDAFRDALRRENHTLKRALTDPRLFDGIGNAYSDEILHAARLSPLQWTSRLEEAEIERLHAVTRETLQIWIERLRAARRGAFPEKVTAFRPQMAVHGKYRKPCPACGAAVQRIRYADNETNYCPRCQTEGRLLADRALSRLLKNDWPRTIEDLEEMQERRRS